MTGTATDPEPDLVNASVGILIICLPRRLSAHPNTAGSATADKAGRMAYEAGRIPAKARHGEFAVGGCAGSRYGRLIVSNPMDAH